MTDIQKNKTYRIKDGQFKGSEFYVEGTDIEIFGSIWEAQDGNPACLDYALRSANEGISPFQDGTVYCGKIGGSSKLIHESQIGEEVKK